MNDGTAFPVVMRGLGFLGLHELGSHGWKWFAFGLGLATATGMAIGIVGGVATARIAQRSGDIPGTPKRAGTENRAEPQHGITNHSLVFNEQLEGRSEVVLVLLLGGMLFVDS